MALSASSDQEELWPLLKFNPIHGLSNNTRRVLSPQSNQQPLQKCINNTHKELLRLKIHIKKKYTKGRADKRLFRDPSRPGEGWKLHSPLSFNPQPSSIFNSRACPSDFSKLSLFHTLFYWSGTGKITHAGLLRTKEYRALLWANASLAHQFFIEWLAKLWRACFTKWPGIMPLSTFDLTSMPPIHEVFTFCGVDLYIVVRGILWDVFVDRIGTRVSMGPSRISTPLSWRECLFSLLFSNVPHLDPLVYSSWEPIHKLFP